MKTQIQVKVWLCDEGSVARLLNELHTQGGTPANVANDIFAFALESYLHTVGYTLICGLWVYRLDLSQPKRYGLHLSVQLGNDGVVTVVLDRPSLIKGSRKAGTTAALMSGVTAYCLPAMKRVQIHETTDKLQAHEAFSVPGAMKRYWRTLHGIELPDNEPLCRVTIEGSNMAQRFTYPSSTLLCSPLTVQELSASEARDKHQTQIEELERQMLQDVAAMPALTGPKTTAEQ